MFSPPYNALRALPCGLILLGSETMEVLSPRQSHSTQGIIPPQFSAIYHASSYRQSPECKWEESFH